MNLWQKYQRLTLWNKVGVWGSICSIIAILLFLLFPTDSNKQSFNVTSTNIQKSVVMVGNQSSNAVTIDNSTKFLQTNFAGQSQIIASNLLSLTQNFYNSPDNTQLSQLREWITNIEIKIRAATNDIQLTRKELLSLVQALKELEERTAVIQKLPDGRTSLGGIIVGASTVFQKQFMDALQNVQSGNFVDALALSKKAIDTIEAAPTNVLEERVVVRPEFKAEIYSLAARSAQNLGSNYMANGFALKSVAAYSTNANRLLLVTTLHNLANDYFASNDFTNALKLDQKAVETYESIQPSISTNFLGRQDALKMYAGGFQSASRLGRTNEAKEFFEKAQTIVQEIAGTH